VSGRAASGNADQQALIHSDHEDTAQQSRALHNRRFARLATAVTPSRSGSGRSAVASHRTPETLLAQLRNVPSPARSRDHMARGGPPLGCTRVCSNGASAGMFARAVEPNAAAAPAAQSWRRRWITRARPQTATTRAIVLSPRCAGTVSHHGATMARALTFAMVRARSAIRADRRRSPHKFALVRTFRIRDAEVPGSNPGTPTRFSPMSAESRVKTRRSAAAVRCVR
jgi:hypothetical protein